RFPVSELTVLTRETPDIVDPDIIADVELTSFADQPIPDMQGLRFGVRPNGKIDFSRDEHINFTPDRDSPLPGLSFWPRTKPGQAGNIAFEFQLDGQPSPLRMPLIFVDNVAANDQRSMAALTHYYNWDKQLAGSQDDDAITQTNRPLRTVPMGGASRRYAE